MAVFFFFSSKTAITLLKQCLMKMQKFLARKGFMFFLSPKVISFSFMQWKKNVLLNKRRIRKIKMHTTGHVEKGSIYTFAQLCLEDHSWNYSRLSFWVVGKSCGVQVPCTKFFKIVAVKRTSQTERCRVNDQIFILFIYLLLLQPDVASGSWNKKSGTDSSIIKSGKLAGLLLLPRSAALMKAGGQDPSGSPSEPAHPLPGNDFPPRQQQSARPITAAT